MAARKRKPARKPPKKAKRKPSGVVLKRMVERLLGPGDWSEADHRLVEISILARPEYGHTEVELKGLALERRVLEGHKRQALQHRKVVATEALERRLARIEALRAGDGDDVEPPPAPGVMQ